MANEEETRSMFFKELTSAGPQWSQEFMDSVAKTGLKIYPSDVAAFFGMQDEDKSDFTNPIG